MGVVKGALCLMKVIDEMLKESVGDSIESFGTPRNQSDHLTTTTTTTTTTTPIIRLGSVCR